MRRQARISAGGALVVRTASALQVWLWLLIFVFQNEFRIAESIKPGYLDFDNLPDTNFTCAGKVIGGYYADLETSCQMFHVCTVGAENETMDIKFLCLNGTVFDQETRVCERVDEVDCTKSEKFYSLNLELYGSTAPPIIQPEQVKPQSNPTEQSLDDGIPGHQGSDPLIEESASTANIKPQAGSIDAVDSTEDPLPDNKKEVPFSPESPEHKDPTEGNHEEEDIDGENPDYEEDYTHSQTTSTIQPITTTTTTTKQSPTIPTFSSSTSQYYQSASVSLLPSTLSSLPQPTHPSAPPAPPSLTPIDPSLLSPQEFIYRHRGPSSETISFQRQSFRPADGIYITHAPPHQFDHFQYESARTAPRTSNRPASFSQRPHPAPFRATTIDPRDQMLRPIPTGQPKDRHEISPSQRAPYPSSLPSQHSVPFDPYSNNFHSGRKRSDTASESVVENESLLVARSVEPQPATERHSTKLSPPRVIVTASASVSDSNGRRLNFTVGNVVSEVKPIVRVNYDDYKESDFDPFFLDVPKLQKRRKSRSYTNNRLITVPVAATVSSNIKPKEMITTLSSLIPSYATTTERTVTYPTTTPTPTWNPNDYVDDNYEPHAYIPPVHPLALLVSQDVHNFGKQDRQSVNNLLADKIQQDHNANISLTEHPRLTSSAEQTTSSQSEGVETVTDIGASAAPVVSQSTPQ